MHKKILSVAMVLVLMLSLTACDGLGFGKKDPTAEDLLAGMSDIDQSKYNDMGMSMKVGAVDDGQEVELTMETGVEMAGDIVHIYDMSMDVGMTGFSMTVELEGWMDMGSSMAYMSMSMMGMDSGWTKSEMDMSAGSSDPAGQVTDVVGKISALSDGVEPELQEHAKGEDWVVTWTLSGESLTELLGDLLADYADGEMADATAEARFGEDDHVIKSVSIVTGASVDGSDLSVDLAIEFRTLNDDKSLEIPADVISSAVDDDDSGDYPYVADPDDDVDPGFSVPSDYVAVDGVTNDGNGYDEYIDPLANMIVEMDPDNRGVYVYHYTGSAEVSYNAAGNGWTGSVTVEHLNADSWSSAEERFADKVSWLESWYEAAPVDGGIDDAAALFMQVDDYGDYELDFTCWSDDIYIEADMYTYDGMSEEAVVAAFQSMIAVVSGS